MAAFILRIHQLLEGIARVAPDGRLRHFPLYALHKRPQFLLVDHLHRLPAKKGETVAVILLQGLDHRVRDLFRERLSVIEIPGDLIEAVLAVMSAPRDEKARPAPDPVCDIGVIDFSHVH